MSRKTRNIKTRFLNGVLERPKRFLYSSVTALFGTRRLNRGALAGEKEIYSYKELIFGCVTIQISPSFTCSQGEERERERTESKANTIKFAFKQGNIINQTSLVDRREEEEC